MAKKRLGGDGERADKANSEQMEIRITAITTLIIQGVISPTEIYNNLKDTYRTRSTFDRDLRKARDEMIRISKAKRKVSLSRAILRYNHIIKLALKDGDLAEARMAQTRLDKLLSLEGVQKVDITTKGSKLVNIPVADWVKPE